MIEKERKKEINSTLLIDQIITSAYECDASDIHIDPFEKIILFRFRIDGILEKVKELEKDIHLEIIGRIKILAGLRIDIHDKAQDGRFFYLIDDLRIDIRVSIMPTYYGENVVIRLLYQGQSQSKKFVELGLSKKDIYRVESALKKPQGLVLISGPTGSGKTTTLYSMLQFVLSEHASVITLEDPVEYAIAGVRQIQIKHDREFTFANALKGILRQDPDIIMVGEIRDKETAKIAIQTALTGHLIFSSIHAPNAASIIPRLIDMGIDPYLIASTVTTLISQRLVRCKDGTSYKGRVGIFEVLTVSDAIKSAIISQKGNEEIEGLAKEEGMTTMLEDGLLKIKNNITTEEEIKRVLYE